MANTAASHEVRLRVGPYSGAQVAVHFEPTGMSYELAEGEWLDVTLRGSEMGLVEIGHTAAAVIVGAWPGAETLVWDREGRQLQV